jgi:hypothetical protein
MMVTFTKELILSLEHTDVVELDYDLQFVTQTKRRPHNNYNDRNTIGNGRGQLNHHNNRRNNYNRNQQNKPPVKIHLRVGEDAWSENKGAGELDKIEKSIVGLLNKLCPKNYDSISEKFMEQMDDEIIDSLAPKIFMMIMKMLSYNETYCRLLKLYDNTRFHEKMYEICKNENNISLGLVEDTREYTSLLETPETVKKRYKKNNISFIGDMYNRGMIQTTEIFNDIINKNDDVEYICLMIRQIHKKLKSSDKFLYDKCVVIVGETIADKSIPFKVRCMCMDIRDLI